MEINISLMLAGVVAGAAPVVLAAVGETVTEKAGLINLSLDGTILLSAMTAFAAALKTQSLTAGFISGAAVGGLMAGIVAGFSIHLKQSQVAVGFVLTLTARDLAYFLGNPFARIAGPQAAPMPIPVLKDIPFLGPVFFQHTFPVYLSLAAIGLCWFFFYKTPGGLTLRAVGENPDAVYARGMNPKRLQMIYAVCGGLLAGLAGAAFSLAVKPGWGRPQGAEGSGWIALALVIFGGWHPVRAAMGAYLFAFLQVMGIYFQGWFPSVPGQVFQTAPFPLMIFTLLMMGMLQKETFIQRIERRPALKKIFHALSGNAPEALGKAVEPDR